MARTQVGGKLIADGSIQRADLDTSTAGQAVITKVVAGTHVSITQTGADDGTGDVTINVEGVEPADSAIQTHITSTHAPSDAQKNSNITKAEIEAKLTGEISSHSHAGGTGSSSRNIDGGSPSSVYLASQVINGGTP